MSQEVRVFGLRQARCRGLAKVHLQDVATAAAMNLARIDDWHNEMPPAQARSSRFAAVASLKRWYFQSLTLPSPSQTVSSLLPPPARMAPG